MYLCARALFILLVGEFYCYADELLQNKKKQIAVDKLKKELEAESISRRGNEKDKKLEKIEAGLASARALIKQTAVSTLNRTRSSPLKDPDYVPHGDIYKNAYLFHRLLFLAFHSMLILGT